METGKINFMQLSVNPPRNEWAALTARPYKDNGTLRGSVAEIISQVREKGDEALVAFMRTFEGVDRPLKVSEEEIQWAYRMVPENLKDAIRTAAANIRSFHEPQLVEEAKVEVMPGVLCWRKQVGIEKVGLYIPGGTAPLFSTVLMLAIPAQIAGCEEMVLCTPSGRDGKVAPAVLFAAAECGVRTIFAVGGAQAIAAMAYGTQSIPAVDKLFGPGNQYVTMAKQLVQVDGIAIDMPAGPSEVCVLADGSASAPFIAADLLSQAEHGADSQVLLVTTDRKIAEEVMRETELQLERLSRKEMAAAALEHSRVVVLDSLADAIVLVNAYAPEHLIIMCGEALSVAAQVRNAGSVFIGAYSPESAGDYASGTNHTLPTNGAARAYSGVSVDSFTKKITFQQLTAEGLSRLAPSIIEMAEAEGLSAHAEAVRIRIKK
jgi:histidinol dehydrogenase